MQPPRRVVEALRSCKQAPPPQSPAGSLSSDVDSTATAADNNKRCGYELKQGVVSNFDHLKNFHGQVRRCLLWFLEACMLLLFCLGLPVLLEFVIVHPRPPGCEPTSTQFSASNSSLSDSSRSTRETGHLGEHAAGLCQFLTAVIFFVIRASNGIQRIGLFYDHVHVRMMYHGDVE